jgi:peptide/nickel transport system substrate-binding protein
MAASLSNVPFLGRCGDPEVHTVQVRASFPSAGTKLLAGVVAVVFLAGGCGSSGGKSSTSPGDTLVVGNTADPDTLDPWKATQFQAVHTLEQIYGTLTELDTDLNVVPGLAEGWQYSPDGKILTLTLRKGVTFQDGKPFTSADVKSSLDRLLDPKTAAVARSYIASIQQVAAPDPNTVVLTLSTPDAGLLSSFATVNLAMLSKDDTADTIAKKPNGTGPFAFKTRQTNQSITLAANPAYWGDKPKIRTLEFRVIPDVSSVVSTLQSGNVQFAVLNDPIVAKAAISSGLTVQKTPNLSYHVLQLNGRQSPLDNVNVRLAISCAIDRKQVLDTAALGDGSVTGPITSPAFQSDPDSRPCPTRDVARAKSLLAGAGLAGGLTLKTIVSQGEYATSVAEAQNLQAQLKDAGITLDLQVLESGAYVARWKAADFDAAVALNGARPDPDSTYSRYFTSTGSFNKVAGFSSAELDQLFAKGKATTDLNQRKATYTTMSKYLEDNAVWVWLFRSYDYTATTKGVSGFKPMPNGSLQYLRSTSVS